MEGTRKNIQKCIQITLPGNIPDSVAGLARLFQIDETYTKDKNIVKFINSPIKLRRSHQITAFFSWMVPAKGKKNNSSKF